MRVVVGILSMLVFPLFSLTVLVVAASPAEFPWWAYMVASWFPFSLWMAMVWAAFREGDREERERERLRQSVDKRSLVDVLTEDRKG